MRIAYVGPFSYPASAANALRVKGVTAALVAAGHTVTICSFDKQHCDGPNAGAIQYASEYEAGLFSCLTPGLRGLFIGDRTIKWLADLTPKPDLILLYGTHLGYVSRLRRFSLKFRIPVIADVVEWYDPSHLPGGRLGPFAISNELSMRFFTKKLDGMLVISRYLEKHFQSMGCPTLRVPPLFECNDERPEQFRAASSGLHLCYAGVPGRKEDIDSLFLGLREAKRAGILFTLHFVGVDADQMRAYRGPLLDGISDRITFYGRVTNERAKEIVASSDFLVLLRGDARFVQAGFPSKVAESLTLGTPVLANITSDLGEFLYDGINSILASASTRADFFSAIKRASQLNDFVLNEMKQNSQNLAKDQFHPLRYAEAIGSFFSERAQN